MAESIIAQSIVAQSIIVQSILAQSDLQAVPIVVSMSMIQHSQHHHWDGITTPNVVTRVKSYQEQQSWGDKFNTPPK